MEVALIGLLQAVSVVVIGGVFARSARRRKGEDDAAAARNDLRAQENRLSMSLMSASLRLGVATAVAVKDGTINGKMSAALDHAETAQTEYYDFINKTAANTINK